MLERVSAPHTTCSAIMYSGFIHLLCLMHYYQNCPAREGIASELYKRYKKKEIAVPAEQRELHMHLGFYTALVYTAHQFSPATNEKWLQPLHQLIQTNAEHNTSIAQDPAFVVACSNSLFSCSMTCRMRTSLVSSTSSRCSITSISSAGSLMVPPSSGAGLPFLSNCSTIDKTSRCVQVQQNQKFAAANT